MMARQAQAARDILSGVDPIDRGGERLRQTRAQVLEGWRQTAANLRSAGDHELADQVRVFIGGMPPAQTESARLEAPGRRPAAGADV
jgi:hypothetical protein